MHALILCTHMSPHTGRHMHLYAYVYKWHTHLLTHTHAQAVQYMQGYGMLGQRWHTGTGNAWLTGWQEQRDWRTVTE